MKSILRAVAVVVGFITFLQGDQITLKNGDRVTGKVIKKDGDKLTFKSDHLGELTVAWDQVQGVQTDEAVNVVLPTGDTASSVVRTEGENLQVTVADAQRQVPLAQVTALRNADEQRTYERLQHPSFLDLWSGTATLGYAGAQGNAKTRTFTTGLTASRITRTDKTSIYFAAIKASADVDGVQSSTAQAARGGWAYSHNISRRVFFNGFNDYEYDRFQNLDLRIVLGGGLGFVAWESERGRLDLLGGVAWNRESFTPDPPDEPFTRNSAELYFGDQFNYTLTNSTSIVQSLKFFPNMTDTGSYRINFDIAANTKLFKWLTWQLAVSDRFLSNPVPGRQKNDLLYSTGIGISFAQ